jgi:hypothetical protein
MFGLDRPNRLLQPWKNVKQFSEELYAMFTSKAPVEHEGPVTIKVKDGETALRLVRGEPGRDADAPSLLRARPVPAPQATADTSRSPLTTSNSRPTPSVDQTPLLPSKKYRPILSVEGGMDFKGKDPVRFDTPPLILNRSTQSYDPINSHPGVNTDPSVLPPLTPYGNIALFGTVVSGLGDSWLISVPSVDSSGNKVNKIVTATIPLIDPSEKAPFGLGIVVIQIGDSYYCQPPVWVD